MKKLIGVLGFAVMAAGCSGSSGSSSSGSTGFPTVTGTVGATTNAASSSGASSGTTGAATNNGSSSGAATLASSSGAATNGSSSGVASSSGAATVASSSGASVGASGSSSGVVTTATISSSSSGGTTGSAAGFVTGPNAINVTTACNVLLVWDSDGGPVGKVLGDGGFNLSFTEVDITNDPTQETCAQQEGLIQGIADDGGPPGLDNAAGAWIQFIVQDNGPTGIAWGTPYTSLSAANWETVVTDGRVTDGGLPTGYAQVIAVFPSTNGLGVSGTVTMTQTAAGPALQGNPVDATFSLDTELEPSDGGLFVANSTAALDGAGTPSGDGTLTIFSIQ